jgi:hypothetical protein
MSINILNYKKRRGRDSTVDYSLNLHIDNKLRVSDRFVKA